MPSRRSDRILKRRVPIPLVLVGVLGVAACGGTSDEEYLAAGVRWSCAAYEEAVSAGTGTVSFFPPEDVLPTDVRLEAGNYSGLIEEECPDVIAAFYGEDSDSASPGSSATDGTDTAPQTSPSGEVDESVAIALRAAGVDSASARLLAVVARETGYLWQSRPPTAEEVDTFAYMAVLECRDVASGERSWADSVAEAVSTGASPEDAQRMTSYFETTFCPMVR